MKKLAIAGASVALAAMPVVGVFAAPTLTHTDTLRLTLSQVCTLGTVTAGAANDGTDSTTHTAGSPVGTWGAGEGEGATTAGNVNHRDTLSATVAAGNTYANLGSTTLTVRCNDNSGFEIKAQSGTNNSSVATLVGTASNTNLILAGDGTGTGTGTSGAFNPAADASYWNFKLGNQTAGVTIASSTETGNEFDYSQPSVVPINDTTVVASTAAAGNLNDGQSVTVTYGAGINNTQAADTYVGSVTYTLVAK